MMLFRLAIFACLALLPTTSWGQTPAKTQNVVLVADDVFVDGNSVLTAKGNVEALMGDMRIRATSIVYDDKNGNLVITGPIRMDQGDKVTILTSSAELDQQFHNGLLRGARLILDKRLQLATTQLRRVDGRYNTLAKTSVSSCKVCDDGRAPLWQIRARRVVHDQQERQIYFDHAQLRILDIPVFYFPRMRLPDPTLDRATGFLIPELKTDSLLGTGVKAPYFIKLGDHKDLTLTPYLATNTRTLEGRYRQAFRNGNIELNGAISDDSLTDDNLRGYLFAQGKFRLKRDYVLSFDLKATSDDAYLVDYDFTNADRLESSIAIERNKRDEHTRVALVHYNSLRTEEDNTTLPSFIAVATTERRFFPASIGGEGRWSVTAHGHYRDSDLNFDSADADNIVDGRDVGRLSAEISWRRNWTLAYGLRAGLTTELAFDSFRTRQDLTSDSTTSQITPGVSVDLRWPHVKTSGNGVTQVLEPIAQIGWVGGDNLNIGNDESTRVEFDEGNLLSLSRFPSVDRRERGVVGAVGFSWSRIAPTGWSTHLTFGQIFRDTTNPDFSSSSGLQGDISDLLVAGQVKTNSGLTLTARGLFDADDGLNKAEAQARWKSRDVAVDATYVWLGPDADEDRASDLSEYTVDGSYRFSQHWSGSMKWRYDVSARETARAGLGLEYQNECVKVNLSVSRRFTSSATVTPSTDFGFTVALLGFSTNSSDQSYTRSCKNAG